MLLKDNTMSITLELSDLRDNVSIYAARISGEPRTHVLPFLRVNETLQAPSTLFYNASYHGLLYTISLLLANGSTWSKPAKTVTLLTSKNSFCFHLMPYWNIIAAILKHALTCLHNFLSLSEPLPLESVHISDYQPAPETGVVFALHSPERNIYSRVNISYSEGTERRFMLYKGQHQ